MKSLDGLQRKDLFCVLLILLLGTSLRVYNLGTNSFWLDEAEVILSANSLTEIIPALKANPLLPFKTFLYKTFVYYWKIFGTSEFILRLSSVIFGIFSIWGIYFLGKLIFSEKAGVFSALVLAVSPFHIYYSQELRMYSIISFLGIASIYFLWRALKDNSNFFWLGYIVANVLNIYMQPIAFFTFVGEILFFIILIRRYKHLFKKWVFSNSMIAIFLVPLSILLISGLKFLREDNLLFTHLFSWISIPSLKSILFTFKNFSIGYNVPLPTALIASIIFLSLFLYGAIKAVNKKEGLILSLICLFLPIISIFLISRFRACYIDRFFIINSIFYYLVIGNGLSQMKTKYLISVTAILIFFFIYALKNYYNNYLPEEIMQHFGELPKRDWRQPAIYIISNFQKGDIILHTREHTLFPFEYYFGIRYKNLLEKTGNSFSEQPSQLLVDFLKDRDDILLKKFLLKDKSGRYIYRIINVSFENPQGIWLVYSWWDKPHSRQYRIIEWMDEHFIREKTKIFPGTTLFRYTNPTYKYSQKSPTE